MLFSYLIKKYSNIVYSKKNLRINNSTLKCSDKIDFYLFIFFESQKCIYLKKRKFFFFFN